MSEVLYEVKDGVAWVTLNRPEFRNAQNVAMLRALNEAYDKAMARKRKNKPTLEQWLGASLDVERHVPSGRAPYAKSVLIKAAQKVTEG